MVQDNDRLPGRIGSSLPFYAFNDTFDRDKLNQNLYWSINRLYTRALEGQGGLCQMLRYNGHMSSFKRDQKVNGEFDLPYTTYSIKIPLNVINFFSTKYAKEANFSLRNQSAFWDDTTGHPIQTEIWRCSKTNSNVLKRENEPYLMHTPDYKYDSQYNYITRDVCTKDGVRYKIDKAKYPFIYSIQETYGNPRLFTHHFTIFIDGYIYADAKFFVDTSHLYIFIITVKDSEGGKTDHLLTNEDVMKEWISKDVPFTIMGFPFSSCKGFIGEGTDFAELGYISFNSFGEYFTPNMQFRNNLWLLGHTSEEGIYVLTPSIAKLENYSDSVAIRDVFDTGFYDKISSLSNSYMEIFNLRHADGYNVIGSSREFQLPLKYRNVGKNPTPPQNIMLFEMNSNNELRFIHNATIKLYYPNVYTISGIDASVKVVAVWFYNYDDTSEHTTFDNPLENYMNYDTNYAYRLLRGLLPSAVTQYLPATVEYDYDDYFAYRRSAKADHNDYMIKKISEVMKDNPQRYEYLYTSLMERTSFKLHANPKQVVYIHDLVDVRSAAVMDNRECCPMYNVCTKKCSRDGAICNEGTCRHNTNYIQLFKIPYVGFRIEHSENCDYRYAVWIDGVWHHIDYLHDNAFSTFIYLPYEKLERATTVEIEMMRVTGRARTEAKVRFGRIDSSIEIPKVFNDISPQSLMISVKKVINSVTIERDAEKSYVRHLVDGAVYGEKNSAGDMVVYRVAPDYEMSWMVFGFIKYKNGQMVEVPHKEAYEEVVAITPESDEEDNGMTMIGVPPFTDDSFHDYENVEYPYMDPNGYPKIVGTRFLKRLKHNHESIHDQYSLPAHLDWKSGSTVVTDVKVNIEMAYREKYPQTASETEEDFENRVATYMSRNSDDAVIMPLNTAINRDYFKTNDNMYFVTTFESPWPNGFFALAKRRFYQYLPYGPNAKNPIYMTPVGKPTRKEYTEEIIRYVHSNTGYTQKQWISGEKIDENDLIYHHPITDRWYTVVSRSITNINDIKVGTDASWYAVVNQGIPMEVDEIIPSELMAYAVATTSVVASERYLIKENKVTGVTTPGIAKITPYATIGEITMGLDMSAQNVYISAVKHVDEESQAVQFVMHSESMDISDIFEVIPGSTIQIKESGNEYGDMVYGIYTLNDTTYTPSMACDEYRLQDLSTRLPVIGDINWLRCYTQFREFFPNPDVYVTDYTSRSFFEGREAIIQNTDIYYSKMYTLDYRVTNFIITENFYDDPSYQKFRITLNGRRLDHGMDYTTDIDVDYGFMRGSPIKITFNFKMQTVKNAILASTENMIHVTGRVSEVGFFEMLSYSEAHGLELSEYPSMPDVNTIYHNIDDNKMYIWDGNGYALWDGSNSVSDSTLPATVHFEFLPYKDRVVWRSRKLHSAEITIPREELKRPLSFAYYDIYYDGLKLTPANAKIVSPRCLKLIDITPDGENISIYERCHDDDLYGNANGMPDSVDDIIASTDKAYKQYLFDK